MNETHEWEFWFPGLWRCDRCDAFIASKMKPSSKTTPMSNEDAERVLAQIDKIDTKARKENNT